MGMEDRAPTPAELERMKAMVARAMGEGAFGISTGLKYLPGAFSETDEVVALSKVAADSGGIYTSHLREEGLGLIGGRGARPSRSAAGRHPHRPHPPQGGRQPMWGSSETDAARWSTRRARRAST